MEKEPEEVNPKEEKYLSLMKGTDRTLRARVLARGKEGGIQDEDNEKRRREKEEG